MGKVNIIYLTYSYYCSVNNPAILFCNEERQAVLTFVLFTSRVWKFVQTITKAVEYSFLFLCILKENEMHDNEEMNNQ